jgi:hypothetical protein
VVCTAETLCFSKYYSPVRIRVRIDPSHPLMIDWLFTVLRPAQEFFTYMETAPFSRLLRHTRECGGSILTRILTLTCRKRRLNGAVLRMRPEKPKSRVTAGVASIKIPPCSMAMTAKHRPKFYSPSPAMVTSPNKWNILERCVKQ